MNTNQNSLGNDMWWGTTEERRAYCEAMISEHIELYQEHYFQERNHYYLKNKAL